MDMIPQVLSAGAALAVAYALRRWLTDRQASASGRTVRCLVLHGYALSAKMQRDHMAGIIESLRGKVTFTFISAPHVVDFRPDNHFPNLPDGEQARGWYLPVFNEKGDKVVDVTGAEESLALIRSADEAEQREHGTGFDCVWGFSQGGAMAALAVGLRDGSLEKMPPPPLRSLRCAIFSSSLFAWPYHERARFAAAFPPTIPQFTMPSLHSIGLKDDAIPREYPRNLLGSFVANKDRKLVEHNGDHCVASDPDSLEAYIEWFGVQLQALNRA